MNDYNNVLVGFSELIKNEEFRPYEGDLRLGVDLGTANIVVSVVDPTTHQLPWLPIRPRLYGMESLWISWVHPERSEI